jgi:hypothetical protein
LALQSPGYPGSWRRLLCFVFLWLLQRQLPVKSRTIVRVLAASSQVQLEVTQVNFFLADVFFCLTVVKVWDNVGLF